MNETNFEKGLDYYSVARTEISTLLPSNVNRVLDLGCGSGVTGEFLKKEKGAKFVIGVEGSNSVAELAKAKLDYVVCGDLNKLEGLSLPKEPYDLILCLDVLEHLIDPWSVLKLVSTMLAPNGTMIVSVPNLRHFKTSLPLLLNGQFKYENSGVRDSTHLRFFTRSSAIALVEQGGLKIISCTHSGRPRGSRTYWINFFTFGIFREFFDFQYLIKATK